MRPFHVLVAGFLCCFLACQKEPDETLTPSVCKLDKIFLYVGSTTVQDTIHIEYSGDQVSKINYPEYRVEPEFFTNGLLARKQYYVRGTTELFRVDHYTYNPDSTLSKVEAFGVIGGTQATQPTLRYLFSWNAKQLTELEYFEDTTGTALFQVSEEYFTYTGNNISRAIYYRLEDQYKDTTNFFYDSQLNYFHKNPVLLLSDIFFTDFFGLSMAFTLSDNNVTSFDFNHPLTVVNLTRDENDKQEIESFTVDGDLYSRYQYKCQ
jgi:hypothetical protein